MNPVHIMLDIEALGTRPGAAVVEVAAVAFDPATGGIGEAFHRHLRPHPAAILCDDTLAWHRERGTWPRPDMDPARAHLVPAANALAGYLADLGDWETIWAWGATYDFPLLEAALAAYGKTPPWKYWQTGCARTVWRLAFPGRRTEPRPHHALEDCHAQIRDLTEAIRHLSLVTAQ